MVRGGGTRGGGGGRDQDRGQAGEKTRGVRRDQDRGQVGQAGEKRTATTPVGAVYKDARRNIQGDENFDDEEESWTTVNYGRGSKDTHSQQSQQESQQPMDTRSYAGAVAGAGTSDGQGTHETQNTHGATLPREKKTLERKFVTPAPEGGFRDYIVVEIRTVNGQPFKGSLHFKEAKFEIFGKCLLQDPAIIHGLSFGFSDYPLIKFKLKHQINIDELRSFEFFDYERSYKDEERTDILSCKIKGIRTDSSFPREDTNEDPNVRWVKVEWCDWSVQEEEILDWLKLYGVPIGELTEDLYPDSDSDTDPTGCGSYSIKMKLHTSIPQLLPMWGKRIRIYHRGIQKLCTNCYGNHARRNCKSKKLRWVDYVLSFMDNHPEIPPEFYGRWKKVIDQEFGEVQPQLEPHAERDPNWVEQEDDQPNQADESSTRPSTELTSANPTQQSQPEPTRTRNLRPINRLSNEEEEELAEFLNFGMTVAEARETKAKEVQLAEIKQQMREHRRNTERGAITSRGTRSGPTKLGPGAASRGRGGALSFN